MADSQGPPKVILPFHSVLHQRTYRQDGIVPRLDGDTPQAEPPSFNWAKRCATNAAHPARHGWLYACVRNLEFTVMPRTYAYPRGNAISEYIPSSMTLSQEAEIFSRCASLFIFFPALKQTSIAKFLASGRGLFGLFLVGFS